MSRSPGRPGIGPVPVSNSPISARICTGGGWLDHGPQRLVDLTTGQGGERAGDQVGALPVRQQFVHVAGAQDEELQGRHASRLFTPGWLRTGAGTSAQRRDSVSYQREGEKPDLD